MGITPTFLNDVARRSFNPLGLDIGYAARKKATRFN